MESGAFFFAARPTIYILVVLTAVLLAQAYTLRKTGIFSCKASGYSADYYLDYCQATAYGDYEHGAFWFGLEPSALSSASKAQALFLGDSRLQFAFSTAATAGWFSNAVTRYYLLGFGYGGNVAFEGELLRKVKPQAKLYVMTVDFFERTESPPAREVMHTPGARSRYQVKRLWQLVHAPICKAVPAICANQYALFRSRETGAYITRQSGSAQRPVSYDPVVDQETVNKYVASGRDFLSHLPVKRECVVLTQIPTVGTRNKAAVAVATALGINLVAPEPDGLQTFDGVHLERSSAERWSKAFFEAAGAQILAVSKPRVRRPSSLGRLSNSHDACNAPRKRKPTTSDDDAVAAGGTRFPRKFARCSAIVGPSASPRKAGQSRTV